MQQVWGFFQFQLQTRGNSGSTEAAGAEAALLGWEDGERKATPAEETGLAPGTVVCPPLPFLMYTHAPGDHKGEWEATHTEQHHLVKDATQIMPTKLKSFNV